MIGRIFSGMGRFIFSAILLALLFSSSSFADDLYNDGFDDGLLNWNLSNSSCTATGLSERQGELLFDDANGNYCYSYMMNASLAGITEADFASQPGIEIRVHFTNVTTADSNAEFGLVNTYSTAGSGQANAGYPVVITILRNTSANVMFIHHNATQLGLYVGPLNGYFMFNSTESGFEFYNSTDNVTYRLMHNYTGGRGTNAMKPYFTGAGPGAYSIGDFTYRNNSVTSAPPAAAASITIFNVTPTNNTQFNNATIRFNVTVNSTNNFSVYFFLNGTLNTSSNHSPGNNTPINFSLTLVDGQYEFRFFANFTNTTGPTTNASSSNNTFFVDTVVPNIVINNFTSGLPYFLLNLTGLFNLTDDFELSTVNISIDGVFFYNNSSLNGILAVLNLSLNLTNLTPGTHTINITLADGHTAKRLNGNITFNNGVYRDYAHYNFYDGGYARITPVSGSRMDVFSNECEIDRCSFTYEPASLRSSYEFLVNSGVDVKIKKNILTPWKEWLVIENHWLDFYLYDEPGQKVNIIRIDNKNVRVIVSGISRPAIQKYASIGDLNFFSTTFDFAKFNATLSFNSSISEMANIDVNLTINKSSSLILSSNATLEWNGTLFSPSLDNQSGFDRWSSIVSVPLIGSSNQTITFSWNYTVSTANGSETGNLSGNQQTITPISMSSCGASNTSAVLNLTLISEETLLNLSGDIGITLFTYTDNLSNRKNFSFSFTGTYNYTICLSPEGENISADAIIDYIDTGETSDRRSNYIIRQNLNNSDIQDLVLYLSNSSLTSTVRARVSDENDLPLFGRYPGSAFFFKLNRYYPAEDISRTVEISRTASDGLAVIHPVLNNIFYTVVIQNETDTLFISSRDKLTTANNNLFFRVTVGTDFVDQLIDYDDLDFSLRFENSTADFVLVFNSISSVGNTICVRVNRRDFRRDELINSSCVTSSSGEIRLGIEDGVNGLYVANVYIEGSRVDVAALQHDVGGFAGNFGQFGIYMAFIIVGVFGSFFLGKPSIFMVSLLAGIIVSKTLGLISITGGVFIVLVGIIGFALFNLRN